jgi:orotate phosphoribosyltransferase
VDEIEKLRYQLARRMPVHVRYGDFVLSDYSRSRFFLDLPSLCADEEALELAAEIEQKVIVSKTDLNVAAIGVLYNSPASALVGASLGRRLGRPRVVLCQGGPSHTSGIPASVPSSRGYLPSPGETVVVSVDVPVSGHRIVEASAALASIDAKSVFVSVVDRRSGRAREYCKQLGIESLSCLEWDSLLTDRQHKLEHPAALDAKYAREQLELFQSSRRLAAH